jgi:hypothetical protein
LKARTQYLKALISRYFRARKKPKGVFLDEICRNTGQNRKYIIRKLAGLAAAK